MTNPILNELQGLSAGAKAALVQAHGSPTPPATPNLITPPDVQARKIAAPIAPSKPEPPPAMGAMHLPSQAPNLPPPVTSAVNVPRGTSAGDSAEESRLLHTGSGVSQIHSKIENSNFGKAHPLLGKLAGWGAEIPARLADVGASAVAPEITANLPGTEYHHLGLVRQAQRQVGQDVGNELKQAQGGEAQANAGHLAEETQEMPGKAEDTHAQSQATVGNLESETNARNNPQPSLATAYAHRVNQVLQSGGDPSADPIVQHLSDAITSIQKPAGTKGSEHVSILGDNGKPTEADFHPETGKYTDVAGNEIRNPRPVPPPPSYGQLILPSKVETFIDPKTNLPTMMQYDPKTQTYSKPMGTSASNAYGHEVAQAGAVERSADSLIQTIRANRDQVGTVGAWIKKNGLNTPIADPVLEGIRAQIASFAALNPAMHGARGAQAMQHFQDIIGDVQQNPDATIAGIQGMVKGAAEPILGQGNNETETRTYQGHTYVKGPQGWHLQQ